MFGRSTRLLHTHSVSGCLTIKRLHRRHRPRSGRSKARGFNLYPSRLLNRRSSRQVRGRGLSSYDPRATLRALLTVFPHKRNPRRDTAFLQRVMQQYQAHLRALVQAKGPAECWSIRRCNGLLIPRQRKMLLVRRSSGWTTPSIALLAHWQPGTCGLEPDGSEALGDRERLHGRADRTEYVSGASGDSRASSALDDSMFVLDSASPAGQIAA